MPPEQEFERLAALYHRSVLKRDRKGFEQILSTDGMLVNADGTVEPMKAWIDRLVTGPLRVKTSVSRRIAVHVHGGSATEVGAYEGAGAMDGKPVRFHERVVIHWVKRRGAWKAFCVTTIDLPPKTR